jgi:LPXTG-motif cell wall-anchored protein
VVRVVEGAEGGHDAATQESSSEDLPSTGEITPIAAYSGLGLGTLALVVALVALLRNRNK